MSDKNKKDTPKKKKNGGGNILHINCIDIKPKYKKIYKNTSSHINKRKETISFQR